MSKRDRIKNNSRSIREDRAAVLPPSLEDEMDTRLFPPTLAPDEEGVIRRAGFVLDINKQELRFEGHQLDQDLWVQMGQYLQQTKDAVQWMIGDWCLLGFETMDAWLSDEDRARIAAVPDEDDGFPQGKYKWLSEMTDYKYSTLRKFSYFSSVFPVFRRRNMLSSDCCCVMPRQSARQPPGLLLAYFRSPDFSDRRHSSCSARLRTASRSVNTFSAAR